MEKIGLGTELKLNINIEPMEGFTMDDYDFVVDVYCSQKREQRIMKKDAIRVDEDNYLVRVDSASLGHGEIKAKITAYIPDGDFDDNVRTEVVFLATNISIIKNI